MKVNVKREVQGYAFDDIETGEVFYGEDRPNIFLLRTDCNVRVAVDLETGVVYQREDFSEDDALYHIVKAEVNIM